jgi:Predicted membrane protein (DUF2079)
VTLTASRHLDTGDLAAFERVGPAPVEHQLQLVWRLSKAALFLQLVGMIVFTTVQYSRFALTIDFANYSQAWAAIAHGHLDPYSTVMGLRFWRNDLELLMWPLALFYWLYPHAVTLLWLQAFAIVGAELVVLAWAKESLARADKRHPQAVPLLGLVAVLLVVTPWSWFTLGFDFHLEPFAAFFALLAARDLWAGRNRRLLLWVPLTLMSCAAAASLYVIAIALAALLTKRGPRLIPCLVLLAGLSWLAFSMAIGGMELGGNHALALSYGYLTNDTIRHVTYTNILTGLAAHPLRALEMFRSHAGYVAGYVASGGIVGLTCRWGLIPAAIVLLPSALDGSAIFIQFSSAFQSWAAVLFLIAGSFLALERLGDRSLPPRILAAFGGLTLAVSVAVGVVSAHGIPFFADRVSPAAAQQLAALANRVPLGAEVIASQGTIGRFAAGRVAYYYYPLGSAEHYNVAGTTGPVWLIIGPVQGAGEGNPAESLQAVSYLERRVHATLVSEGAGVWGFRWAPPRGIKSLLLP